MALTTETKAKIVTKHQRSVQDTGSAEVQIALLSANINNLTEHFKTHTKDNSSKRGLIKMVSRRRKLLNYLQRKNSTSYLNLIQELGIRK